VVRDECAPYARWHGRNDVTDLRVAAYIVAIDRVAKSYRSKGL
jgi:glutamate dehydrogenase (NAD(P)+)